jgi:acetyl-CoA acyltransferase
MKEEVFVVGVGMTRFGRWLDRSLKSLVAEAVIQALKDANCQASDVEVAFFSNTTQSIIEGQHLIRGQIALREIGIESIPIVNVENACASGSTAFYQAINHLRGGAAEIALVVGAEKMYDADRVKSAAVFDGGWDVHEWKALAERLVSIGASFPTPAGRGPGVASPFMELYASLAKGHMSKFGTTERQLATVAAKNHRHSTLNPLSQYQNDMSVEDVLAGKLIAWPLTLPMCSPISDGAAAAILCTKRALQRLSNVQPVSVIGCALASGSSRQWTDAEGHICRRAADKAYDEAGVGPQDMSVAEVHDASAFAEIVQIENLRFCEIGEGGSFSERGETALGGRIPVNPSGGLESKGHPIGATGLGQIYELVQQLRGEAGARQVADARLAIAENGGGFIGVEEAAAVVTILGR